MDEKTTTDDELRGPMLVGRRRSSFFNCENAHFQEVTPTGVRILSGRQVQENDSLVLYVGRKWRRMHAKVLWAKKEGLITKRKTGKVGQAFVAFCRLREHPESLKPSHTRFTNWMIRGSVGMAALSLAGLFGYAASLLSRMFGG